MMQSLSFVPQVPLFYWEQQKTNSFDQLVKSKSSRIHAIYRFQVSKDFLGPARVSLWNVRAITNVSVTDHFLNDPVDYAQEQPWY